MTLVVARRIDGRIYIVGDTQLTPEIPGARDGQENYIGCLKIVVLHPGSAIAFANNKHNAQLAIEGIHSRGIDLYDKNAVLQYLHSHHTSSLAQGPEGTVEFMVAAELEGGVSELFIIKNGDVLLVDAGYIGNSAAYNRFRHREQELMASMPGTPPSTIAMQSLRTVIADCSPELQNVSGFPIGLQQSENDGFHYVFNISIEGIPVPVHNGPMAPVTFGGAPEGSNNWTFGSRPGDRLGVLTAFCNTASFGVIYRPAISFTPRIVLNCTQESLVEESLREVNQICSLLDQFHS